MHAGILNAVLSAWQRRKCLARRTTVPEGPDMPVVSVIMAFHRVTPFLRPAVQSILGQTVGDLELLIVDDGAGQGLAALGDEGRDPRVRFIRFPQNRGIATAHNAAVAQARGEFIALMDYDDIALPRRCERQVAEFRTDKRVGLLFTHAAAIDANDRVIEPQFTLTTERDHRLFSSYSMPATSPTLMARREVFAAHPMRAEFRISPDYDLFTRVVETWPSRALPEVLLLYRRHAEQTTAQAQRLHVQNACRVRLLTARRRSGRRETSGALAGEFGGWHQDAPPPEVTYAEFARRALEEDFPLLAVYFARKLLSLRRNLASQQQALAIVAGALVQAPRSTPQLLRMFITGPLRTHGLRPV
jgi:glycosyltransferase involved in cell wall biosynthesis